MYCWLIGAVVASVLLTDAAQAEAQWQSHESILAAAAEAVRLQTSNGADRVETVAQPLDPRVRLKRCEQPLVADVPYSRKQSARVTAQVRCVGASPWKIHVPVRLALFRTVVVAERSLARDSLLTAGDISLAQRDVGVLDYGYLTASDQAIGNRLRRGVDAGEALTPGNLEIPALVKRGQRVTLTAQSGGVSVRMAGIAQADGTRGEVIKVENLNSGRLIQAIVRSAQSVEVLLQ